MREHSEGRRLPLKAKRKPADSNSSPADYSRAVKLSVNVSPDVGMKLRRIAFDERLSESSIVEIALAALFARTGEANVGTFLREHGASLRRGTRADG